MQNYKAITSDLDGTLLTDDQTLSEENSTAITEIINAGIQFVPCTGRTVSLTIPDVKYHPSVRYFIYSNGAVVWDKQTGKKITAYMSKETITKIFDIVENYDYMVIAHVGAVAYVEKKLNNTESFRHYRANDYYQELYQTGSDFIDGVKDFCISSDEVEMFFIMFHTDEEMQECKAKLQALDGVHATNSAPFGLEVISTAAGKGNGLKRLAQMLDITTEEIVAIGDSPNDYTMIETAGYSLVVDNGAQMLKDIADEVICSNNEHAAKFVLEHYIKR